jgi:HEAT repeat protein
MADKTSFLADIRSNQADVRFAAWRSAGEQNADVIPELAAIASSTDAGVRKAALEAMTTLTHSVGKDEAGQKRSQVGSALVGVAISDRNSTYVRGQALRLLSLLGGDDAVAAAVKLLSSPDLREEAVYCIERIPGAAATKALVAAYGPAPSDFKPRILAALGHRRDPEGVPLTVAAMQAADKEIAIAGLRAFGRIGRKPSGAVKYPPSQGLSGWQAIDHMDSRLRYADWQTVAGNHAEAMAIYKSALDAPEEHRQCAAIVGLGRMGTPQAASMIFPKLKSPSRKVRITAGQVWRAMAATQGA